MIDLYTDIFLLKGYTLEEIDAIFAIPFSPFRKTKDQIDAINRTRIQHEIVDENKRPVIHEENQLEL